ncbi:helix-turn-helix transcriptional regulator [Enterobacter ludwigii]|uniref:helix-turn-helix transcriptional regulator n=1 Tax=Enterobacter ludwigii TaxID=299767 RepID=UPI0039760753
MDALSRKRPGTWVISACTLTRSGTAALLAESGCAPGETVLLSGREYRSDVLEVLRQVPPARILFFLSPSLRELLAQIKLLGWLMNAGSAASVLLVCGAEQVWIFDTLRKIAGDRVRTDPIRILPARAPVSTLRTVLKRWGKGSGYTGPHVRPLPAAGVTGLSPRELQSLQMTLEGISVPVQACLTGLSSKTLYTHRSRAVRKLSPEGSRRGAYRLWQLFTVSDINGVNDGDM